MINILIALLISSILNPTSGQNICFYSIGIYINSTEFDNELKIQLKCYEDSIEAEFSVIDSVQTILLENNSNYKLVLEKLAKSDLDSAEQLICLLHKIKSNYTIYFQDSLIIRKSENNDVFINADLIGFKDVKFLNETIPDNNRMILDGNSLKIFINTENGLSSEYWINKPTKASHPIIYNLIVGLLNDYRSKKPGTLLDKSKRTFNY